MPTFDFIYKEFKVKHFIGELPKLQLIFDTKISTEEGWAVYIPRLEWKLELMSTRDQKSPSMTVIGDWGTYESAGPAKLFKRSKKAEVTCTIPMSSPKIKQMIDIRSRGEMPRFEINVGGTYLDYKSVDNHYCLRSIGSIPRTVAKMYYKGEEITHVTFTTDEITKLLEQINTMSL